MKSIVLLLYVLGAALTIGSAKEWLSNANYYQIYPTSFKDSDGDGIGDLQGIRSKAAYLKGIGMDGVWLSPIMASPMKDAGYDISDYRAVNPMFGTVQDVEDLVKTFKENGLHLILDFVPNHTSDEHEWFLKSCAGDPVYKDYYIWHPGKPNPDGGQNLPPNNWVSVFRYSAWTWNEQRQAYYYHAFLPGQPDLNYRNPKVVEEMKDVLRYWLKKGIAGFRIDAVPFLFEINADADGNYMDEPLSGDCDDPTMYCYLKHIHTNDQPETFDMAYQWRDVVDEFKDEPRVLLIEAYTSLPNIMRFYGTETKKGAHIPFNFELLSNLKKDSTAKQMKTIIENYMNHVPYGKEANWVLGNHDNHRIASRLGEERADLYNILLQTLPGNAVTYQGEELCMPNVRVSWKDTKDPGACNTNETVYHEYSRDPARTPFPWNSEKNGGFSTADSDKLWLPMGSDYVNYNVDVQEKQSNSHLKVFRKLVQLKKTKAFQEGLYESAKNVPDDLYIFTRSTGAETYVVALNYGKKEAVLDLPKYFRDIPTKAKVVAASLSANLNENQQLSTSSVRLVPSSGIVVQLLKDSPPTTPPTTQTPETTTKPNNVDKPTIAAVTLIICFVLRFMM